ncbi:MAG: pyridoxamine 5'-phosphate oxidase family protein [Deltaproteobacteria bacterium]|jgi:uncharacterized pyridoxamine 5'-phosphate oxidase family protein|nr:pyridoxamine 5'-phosphate oxidase family protein [Deltaproteobacteria bacterium]
MTVKKVYDFLDAHRPFYLATIEGDTPKVRPMGFLMFHEDKIWIGMGDNKEVYKQIKANPKVQVVSTDPDTSNWIRISGYLEFVDDPALFEMAMEVMPMLKEIYVPGGPRMAIGYFKEAKALFVDFKAGVTETVAF